MRRNQPTGKRLLRKRKSNVKYRSFLVKHIISESQLIMDKVRGRIIEERKASYGEQRIKAAFFDPLKLSSSIATIERLVHS